jgi:hypothetical protein
MPTEFSRTSDMTGQQQATRHLLARERGGFLSDVADLHGDSSDSPWARQRAGSRTERML